MKDLVLWIDDQPNQDFLDAAYEDFDVKIENIDNYEDGIIWLKEHRELCHAVILDVNCKGRRDEVASKETSWDLYFTELEAVCREDNKPLIPWFVYTAGDCNGIEDINAQIKIFKRIWDDTGKLYYKKPGDRIELFEIIRKVIDLSPTLQHAKKYENIFKVFSNKEHLMSLLRIFKVIEINENNNSSIYNDIRKVLEATSNILKDKGFFPEDQQGLSAASYYMREICKRSNQNIVPSYISYCFTACEDICNDGSHDGGKTPLCVDKDTSNNKVPYLIRSAFYMLCNIIVWADTLSCVESDVKKLREKIEKLKINKYLRQDIK